MHLRPFEPRRMMDAADLDASFGDGGGVLFDVGPDGGHDRCFANDGASDYVAGGAGDDRADVDQTDELDFIVGEMT